MKKKIYLVVILLVICTFCVSLFLSANPVFIHDIQYDFIYGGKPQRDPFNDPPMDLEYYDIDPTVIIKEIDSGKHDVFRRIDDEPESFANIYPSGTFNWSQNDYLTIAKAHHQYLTNEPIEDNWKIYGYNTFGIYQCRDHMQGFDGAKILFYKETPEVFFVTYMLIYPLNGMIYSTSTKYKRETHFVDNADAHFYESKVLSRNLTAEEALQIAENTQGKIMRNKLSNNDCSVSVSDFGDEYWYVSYSWYADDLIYNLDFKINANDGSYEISQHTSKCKRDTCP